MKKQIVAAALGASILILVTGCGDKPAAETAQHKYEVPPAPQKLAPQDLDALRKVPGNSIPPADTAAAEKEKQELLDRVQRIERELAEQKAKEAQKSGTSGNKPPVIDNGVPCGRNC
jgi:hypothetical protein